MKILATIYKEFLVLVRDLGGLALIFLMPFSLVIIMALIQDAPFRDYQEIKFEVLLVDLDQDSLSAKIKKDFAQSSVQFQPMSDSTSAISKVKSGEFKAVIIIPEKATSNLKKKSNQTITQFLSSIGVAPKDSASTLQAVGISILYDPAIKSNFKQALSSAVEKVVTKIQTEYLLSELQHQLDQDSSKESNIDFLNMVKVREAFASENQFKDVALNSVQHNVPGWAMFAMFFILFPLAGNFIKEREEGSMLRLRLIANSNVPVITGKFVLYFIVCLVQFALMILAGLYVMPWLGLDKLILGNNLLGIVIGASAVAMAATAYGLLIATVFKTPQQALSFGSISVVILAAIGGIWVPAFVMPPVLQTISEWSPLHWGLSIFNDLFLRGATIAAITPDLLKLLSFSCVVLSLSIFAHKVKTGV